MRRIALLAALLCFSSSLSLATGLPAVQRKPPVFLIQGPTIIAFFPVTEAELEKDGDTNEALSDFQFYLEKIEKPLKEAGVTLGQSYAGSFQVKTGTAVRRFVPKDRKGGYYFIAPGKDPHFEYGVLTDLDLKDAVKKYFGIAVR